MVFNSFTFLIFFALVLFLHRLPIPWTARKVNLLVASYLFYAAWNPPFILLLWLSTVMDWTLAKRIHATTTEKGRKAMLIISLAMNLGLLGYFKYSGFLLQNLVAAAHLAGIDWQPAALDVVLPVGISFYTFQTLSYTLDVYLRRETPWTSFLDYALYVTFFPQLVAGPIVRSPDFLPQCEQPKRATADELGYGFTLLVLGLFEKVVLADHILAPHAEALFGGAGAHPTFTGAWAGTLAFAGQIFCDFAGYSTCAIGASLCLGFWLPENFHCPYGAVGFSDFWRRWHVSLSTWLRDYLYIPLGGNRRGPARTDMNLMTTMLLGGLWHGASWNFVVWGGLHGTYLAIEKQLKRRFGKLAVFATSPAQLVLGLATFALVCVTWVFFRAHTFAHAAEVVSAMFGFVRQGANLTAEGRTTALLTVAGLVFWHWILRNSTVEGLVARTPWWLRSTALAAMLLAMMTMPGEDRAFIYFQF